MNDKRKRCLLVDPDRSTVELLIETLAPADFAIRVVTSGEEALKLCRQSRFDVLILEDDLPGISGQATCRQLRQFSDTYVLMVTANPTETTRVVTLAIGADDYISKPFVASELLERIHAMMRRQRHPVADMANQADNEARAVIQLGPLNLDTRTGLVAGRENFVDLTELEAQIVATLVHSSPESVSRNDLRLSAWGQRQSGPQDHVVDVHISNIRSQFRKAGLSSVSIKSVRSVGYRLFVKNQGRPNAGN